MKDRWSAQQQQVANPKFFIDTCFFGATGGIWDELLQRSGGMEEANCGLNVQHPPFPLIPSSNSLKHRSFIFSFKNASLSKIMWNSGKISLKNLPFVSLIFLLIFPIISSTSFQRRHHQRQHWDWTASDDQSVDEVNSKEAEQSEGGRILTKSAPQNHRKMNAAGFFYISADFPMESEQRPPHDDLANEDCSMYPNGTFKAPYAFTCSDPQNGPPLFVVHDTALANRSARYEYPLDLRDASPMLRVFMDLTSFATRSFESMRAEVALLRRKVGWLGCGWMPIPTFGAFDSMDICEDNDSCPIFPGRQVLELRLEPSNMFLTMLRFMLQDEKPPYELRIRLINNRSHGEELLCVVFQTRLIF